MFVCVLQRTGELPRLVDIVDESLPKSSELSNQFLYSLAQAAGGEQPSLVSILQYQVRAVQQRYSRFHSSHPIARLLDPCCKEH